jgi:predicted ABC-type ATPase
VPQAIILAGPNGAGKTTFANEYLLTLGGLLSFVNADEIAREAALSSMPSDLRDVRAGRAMLRTIDEFVGQRADFMVETTLATLTYARRISAWQSSGYSVVLLYLRLPSVDHSIARVRRRVEAGGHDIPEAIIRRRFTRSLLYLDRVYKPAVDEWYIWDSNEGNFTFAESWNEQSKTRP